MSGDTHDYVHNLLERNLGILVIEQESASDLEVILNELSRHGYSDVTAVTAAAATVSQYTGPDIVLWRYVAVVREGKGESTPDSKDTHLTHQG